MFPDSHTHQLLVDGKSKLAENYPADPIIEIRRGIQDTNDHRHNQYGEDHILLAQIARLNSGFRHASAIATKPPDPKHPPDQSTVTIKYVSGKTEERNIEANFKNAYMDEYTNEKLDDGLVRKARLDELHYFCRNAWEITTEDAVRDNPGVVITSGRWTKSNTGGNDEQGVRCLDVATQLNREHNTNFYAATPPLEANNIVCSQYAHYHVKNGKKQQLRFICQTCICQRGACA